MISSNKLVRLGVLVSVLRLGNEVQAQDVATLLGEVAQGHSGATAKTVSSNETFDTDTNPIFYFTSFTVASGQTLSVTGSNPLVIIADTINIHGTIDVSGGNGQNASEVPNSGGGNGAGGGAGGGAMLLVGRTSVAIHAGGKLIANGGGGGHAGGSGQGGFSSSPWNGTQSGGNGQGGIGVAGGVNGGNGGASGQAGSVGGAPTGTGGGSAYHGGVPPGAGGGGYGTAGQKGFSSYWGGGNTNGGAGGSTYGNSDIDVLYGGSGGGGGGE